MSELFKIPLRMDFLASLVIILFSIFGIIFYKNRKDKFFLLAIVLVQIVILGVLFDIIKHFPNILKISSIISTVLIIIFLIIKDDKVFTYISFLLHFVSIFQLLYILKIIE